MIQTNGAVLDARAKKFAELQEGREPKCVQDFRKESGLEVADRIRLYVDATETLSG